MADTRSPRYPNVPLNDAIAKAKAVYQKEHMSPLTPQVAAEAMGYKGLNGASLKMISSLKKYGLLDGRGEDVRLTKAAQVLIIDSPDSPDYREAIRRSALSPEVFSDIYKQFKGTGSERNIAVFLEKQGFKPDAAALVARNYKETMALVPENWTVYDEDIEELLGPRDVATATEVPVKPSPAARGTPGVFARATPSESVGDAEAPFRIVLDGKQLKIEANVDLAGLQLLKQVLDGYEAMLKLLAPKAAPDKNGSGAETGNG